MVNLANECKLVSRSFAGRDLVSFCPPFFHCSAESCSLFGVETLHCTSLFRFVGTPHCTVDSL